MRNLSRLFVLLLHYFVCSLSICACATYSINNGDGGVVPDGETTVDDGDSGGNEDGDMPLADGEGGDPGNPVACACKNSEDTVGERGTCVRENYTCNAMNLCEDGYECQGNYCGCVDLDICGVDCSSGCLCPEPHVCDERTDTCRMPLACLEDEMCPDGQVCREGDMLEFPIMYFICIPHSGVGVGGHCGHNLGCLSGVCHTDICLQACDSNSECPNGQFCSEAGSGKLGCVIQTNCGADCDGFDEFCDFMECRNDNCRSHADCPGDCTIQIDRPVIGHCTERALCEDDEFIIDTGMEAFCLIYQACWTDGDCAAPYICLSGDDLSMPPDEAAFCGRLVRSEECRGDCPNGTICYIRTGTCIQPDYCLEDEMCPQGEICAEGMPMIDGYLCLPPSGGDLGEPCREPSDCKSGICEDRICLQACRTNSDCPAGQYCGEINRGKLGCVLQTQCPTCTNSDEFCDGFSCQTVNCRTGADCINDCAININRPLIGECVQSNVCSDTEFFSRPMAFCLTRKICMTDADCGSPYHCIPSWELGLSPEGPSFCGRNI